MLIDTHCHLEMMADIGEHGEDFLQKIQLVKNIVDDSCDEGVCQIITIGTTASNSNLATKIALSDPRITCTIGIHPCDAPADWKEDIQYLEHLLQTTPNGIIVGIGETGLDFYHEGYNKQRQTELFEAHLKLAQTYALPVVVHTRNAFPETFEVLRPFFGKIKGVIHCFSENSAAAKLVAQEGFLIGIGGAVTYPKNNVLREVISTIGLNHIILETDAPFLPPQIIRGKQNHPRHIATIAQFIADFLHVGMPHVANTTTRNAQHLFNLSKTLRHI